MEAYKIYAGGVFLEGPKKLAVINPHSGEIFANTSLADKNILELSIQKALEIEQELANLPVFQRYSILMEIAAELEADKNAFAELLSRESAKPIRYAVGEIERSIQTFIVAAEEAKRLPGEYLRLDWTAPGINKEGIVKYFPVGLVAGISPFNFPLNLAVHKIAPAIASGCPIILKPSSSTPLSTLRLARLIDKTKLTKGAVSILPMSRETGNMMVSDKRFKLLSFTGSPEVGWKMKSEAGKKKVLLELGGNAGVIVTQSCDLDLAIKKCVVGGFAYSGQVCIHAQRIYVHHNIFDAFTKKFKQLVEQLLIGDPADIKTDISGMIDEANAMRVETWVNEAISDGAQLITGGVRKGNYYPPTVLSQTHPKMKVCSLEVFGPVVTLEPYENFEEAINFVNEGSFGLQAGVFTNYLDEVEKAFNNIRVGGVIINDVPTFRVDHMPYGGIKDSGLGREGIKYAMIEMMEARVLVKNILT